MGPVGFRVCKSIEESDEHQEARCVDQGEVRRRLDGLPELLVGQEEASEGVDWLRSAGYGAERKGLTANIERWSLLRDSWDDENLTTLPEDPDRARQGLATAKTELELDVSTGGETQYHRREALVRRLLTRPPRHLSECPCWLRALSIQREDEQDH